MRKNALALLAGAAAAFLGAGQALAATIVVGPEDSIQDAVNAANPGDTVKVLDGRYNQTVVIDKAIKLQGQSKAGVILDGSGLYSTTIQIAEGTTGAVVKNLTIVFSDEDAIGGWGVMACSFESFIAKGNAEDVVAVYGSNSLVKNVTARGNRGGIYIEGAGTQVLSSKLLRSGGGVDLYGGMLVKSVVLEDVDDDGIDVNTWNGSILSDRNSVRRSPEDGLSIWGSSVTTYKDKARAVSGRGLRVYAGSWSYVTEPNMKKVGETAVHLDGYGTTMSGGKFDLCGLAIACSASDATITGNNIKNGHNGIHFYDVLFLWVNDNVLKNLQGQGIYGQGAWGVWVEGNTVTEVGGHGDGAVSLIDVQSGRVSSNVIGDVDDGHGIRLWTSAMVVGGLDEETYASTGNTISDASRCGVWVGGYNYFGTPTISHNTVTNSGNFAEGAITADIHYTGIFYNNVLYPASSGIVLTYRADGSDVASNYVYQAGTNGILVATNDYGQINYDSVVEYNVVINSGSEGIDNEGSNSVIRGNLVTGSGIYDFANGGSVVVSASIGNSPDTGDWSSVPGSAQQN